MKKLMFLCAVVLLLSGCAAPATPPEAPSVPETTQPTTLPPEPVRVYPGAQEAFLDIENHSSPREHAPEFIMLHFTSAVVEHRDDPYNMTYVRQTFLDYEVSIHYIIDRGGTVHCFIPEDRVAWHAGKGQWAGEEKYTNKMNQYAIGIEIMAIGSQGDMAQFLTPAEYAALDPALLGYTDAQYTALRALVEDLCTRLGIPMDRQHIIGHEDYTDRKSDPGELFDWQRLLGAGK